ncbi:MAG TPA: peptidoglycan editing factor PgeF [Candidatus Atribacteria bacterium]|nr:peptidoglycan editing factor PgeF [Candidatus Atribacteria bacterium]
MAVSLFAEHKANGLVFFTIPSFTATGLTKHGFSSRQGGVSTGECSSLNLSLKRKDLPENVRKNFEIFCDALGIDTGRMVFAVQAHGDKVAAVDEKDRGKGFMRGSDITEADGLITDKPGVALVTFHADCVPLFFLDPEKKAIGLAHAGWRGTIARIGAKTIAAMQDKFNTDPGDCLAAIGPSIGQCCFEVDKPVADGFRAAFPQHAERLIEPIGEKYHVDLWLANKIQLIEAGIREENITIAGMCTACNKDMFFSHRRDLGRTGSHAAMIMLA